MRPVIVRVMVALVGIGLFAWGTAATNRDEQVVTAEAAARPVVAVDEAAFAAAANRFRAERGLAPLASHGELSALARAWAERMASDRHVRHEDHWSAQLRAAWRRTGENVGVGQTVRELHDAFAVSTKHVRNLADPGYTHIGVGTATGDDGALYVVVRFAEIRPVGGP